MAYDPIINYYDKPGGPSISGSDSGSGGGDHGGGGEEATLGSMQSPMLAVKYRPVVGESFGNAMLQTSISDVYVGSQHVIGAYHSEENESYYYNNIQKVASGVRVTNVIKDFEIPIDKTTDDIDVHMYVATSGYNEVPVYTSVMESDVEPSLEMRHLYDTDQSSHYAIFVTITQPELNYDNAGEALICYVSVSE
jgi:hypothetical protein